MPQFAANLTLMYTELPFLDRFGAAARDGFSAVEFQFPYAWAAGDIAARLQDNGLQLVLFNAPAGGADPAGMAAAWDQSARGTAALPGREAEFRAGVQEALRYADVLGCPRIHVLSGIVPSGVERESLKGLCAGNLRWAADEAARSGREILIEPINLRDVPRYFLNRQDHAHELLDAVQADNLKVQMDLYHCQIVEGDVATKLRRYLPTGRVAHIQIAGVPYRHEPDQGELHYPYLLDTIDALGWRGWVGCEYRPAAGTTEGLGWRDRALARAAAAT
ncbi:hydroxypyruvate isomerase [Acidovorax sp. Leaf76]|uniref:2-oxo-tetronate isomerase n=1 Tax=unclassified Acidovorax TaxID=2684926 RepID=UPI0006F39400|nr:MULTISPECIES: 2-oxo-tetronate isomerase [unclassified Acidovorax]KQO26701.1 hydroxypyruvate isomerase [Acidovorax sp. Leaf76]KQO40471.1 hydroxypyruvate isomerase [Acidovorax sp. Leaf84]KQS42613.1 hydroxypyruvate isomerase [Acidovorax sp. Leaf191]